MSLWKIAAVQMECRLGAKRANLDDIIERLREAAGQGARLVVFPECALTGYCFESKEEAWPYAEPIPGPSTLAIAEECKGLGVLAVVGMLESVGDKLFNAAILVSGQGVAAQYRKIHLPHLGVDRFTTPGDRPFAVHDLGGLQLGMTLCYDGSFPEAARCLMLLGADLVVLPTNWPTGASSTVQYLIQARALENFVYFAAVNRVGQERGFHFIGKSRIVDCNGELLAATETDEPTILYAELNSDKPRNKRIVHIPGKYEIDRIAHRRPEMYEILSRKVQPRLH
ncbi:MAG: carbon-nitrogen hydrolase family protein [Gemmataceae bacterium]|nr:carbon-nitrogen hydrolase family protein [Gemmataceae bacterium]